MESISPSTASIIAPFTITGSNFGNYVANYTRVLVNGTTSALTLWSDTKIQGKLPPLPAGNYPVQVQRSLNGGLTESATAYVTIVAPIISSVTPSMGQSGTVFNIYGSGFGPYDASQTRVTLGGSVCTLTQWTDTNIRGTVPSGAGAGLASFYVMRGQSVSNGMEFTIPGGGYGTSEAGLSALNAEFKLGDMYVYPDPAKNGKPPVFHVEVGVADSVKIRVFTVAGQLAHETELTGMPPAIGAAYADEYSWEGRIASGVYYYAVTAEKGGKKISAKGKFSVIR